MIEQGAELIYLVDTTDTETKGTSLDASAVHIITNKENQLRKIKVRNTYGTAKSNVSYRE